MHALITGIGVVSPYGVGAELFWEKVRQGEQGFSTVTLFNPDEYRNTIGGQVPDFDEGENGRAAAFAVTAAEEAIRSAGIDPASGKLGIILGTNFGGIGEAEKVFAGQTESRELTDYLPANPLKRIRERFPSKGPQAVLSLSCASGAAAVATALEWIRAGHADTVLAGGFDELSETSFAGLSALRAIAKETVKPFDVNRGGTIFSEGAGVLVVESAQHAAERGAVGVARLLGRGMNNDAFHMTAPDKTGHGIAAVMKTALADAGISPDKVRHLNCHGTGTKYNDMIETTAIKDVFGTHVKEMIFTANKSLFGHAMGAAGALETAVTCFSIRDDIVPPIIGCSEQDPELDLTLCLDNALETTIPVAMTNSYGLGGTNASLVLAKAD